MERIGEPGHYAPGHGFELGAIASGQMLFEPRGRFAEVQPRRRRGSKGQGSQGNPLQLAAALAHASLLVEGEFAHPRQRALWAACRMATLFTMRGIAAFAVEPERRQIPAGCGCARRR